MTVNYVSSRLSEWSRSDEGIINGYDVIVTLDIRTLLTNAKLDCKKYKTLALKPLTPSHYIVWNNP